MPMTPKQMIRLLEQNGFVLVSANGSHYKIGRASCRERV